VLSRSEAMAKLSFMRGVWAGPASGVTPQGKRYTVHQTERMGPMLGGDVIVVEGRGYEPDGKTAFNALGVVSWDAHTHKYEMRSYAQGMAGTFEMQPIPDGYIWTIPAGPATTLRYTAHVKDGHWREIGETLSSGKPPVQFFEMNLTYVGPTDWPLGQPVPASAGR
jgi:hypothetical protein